MDNIHTYTCSATVESLCEINPSFDKGVLRVAYTGQNRNGTSISREVFEAAVPTIYNCPLVCHYDRESDSIGGHDEEIVVKDSVPTLIHSTHPVGVVPESAKWWWEDVEDITGIHTYFCIEVILWRRQEAYLKIKEDKFVDQSMEIKIERSHYDDNILTIDSFVFLAFCLLGNVQPCFESACLEVFSQKSFQEEYTEMLDTFKHSFIELQRDHTDEPNLPNKTKGGISLNMNKKALLAKFDVDATALDFDIDTITEEEFASKLGDKYSLLGEAFRQELITELSKATITDDWGDWFRYSYFDYDVDKHEVYAYDVSNEWQFGGFTYSIDGDAVTIDFNSWKRKKLAVVDFEEGEQTISYGYMFDSALADAYRKKDAQFSETTKSYDDKISQMNQQIDELNSQLNELQLYQQTQLQKERTADEDAVFSMFADLNGIEAFESLKSDCANLTISELEEKCFALRGRQVVAKFAAKETKEPSAPRLPIERKIDTNEPYGGLFEEFPPTR